MRKSLQKNAEENSEKQLRKCVGLKIKDDERRADVKKLVGLKNEVGVFGAPQTARHLEIYILDVYIVMCGDRNYLRNVFLF